MQRFSRFVVSSLVPRPSRHLNTDVPLPKSLDTHKVVKRFQEAGLTAEQAEALMEMCTRTLDDCMHEQRPQWATKFEFVNLKSELQLLGKTDFALLKHEVALLEKRALAEIATVGTEVERIENRFIKWAIGASLSVGALLMAYSRLRMSMGG